jgi:hypothetical protein
MIFQMLAAENFTPRPSNDVILPETKSSHGKKNTIDEKIEKKT